MSSCVSMKMTPTRRSQRTSESTANTRASLPSTSIFTKSSGVSALKHAAASASCTCSAATACESLAVADRLTKKFVRPFAT